LGKVKYRCKVVLERSADVRGVEVKPVETDMESALREEG